MLTHSHCSEVSHHPKTTQTQQKPSATVFLLTAQNSFVKSQDFCFHCVIVVKKKKKKKNCHIVHENTAYSLYCIFIKWKKSPPPPTGVKFSEWRWPLLYLLIDFLIFFNYSQLLINKMPENIQKSPRLPSKTFNLPTLSAFNHRLKMVWSRIFYPLFLIHVWLLLWCRT